MKPNPLKDKSLEFAIQIVKTCQEIQSDREEYILTKQLMRSGTAIGALYRESENAESRADFIHNRLQTNPECIRGSSMEASAYACVYPEKLAIAQKE